MASYENNADSKIHISNESANNDTKKKIQEIHNPVEKLNPPENAKNEYQDNEFDLHENKKSLGYKPFRIVEPNKETIVEKLELENASKPSEEEKKLPDQNDSKPEKKEEIETQKEVIINRKSLNLEVLESPSVKLGTIITINPSGLEGSKREVNDGRSFFGTYVGNDQYQINDYTFPMEEQGFGKRHFVIEYNNDKDAYYLKDLGDGTGTFIRINQKVVLNTNMIISFNSIHIAVIFPPEQRPSNSDLSLNDPLKEVPKDIIQDKKSYVSFIN